MNKQDLIELYINQDMSQRDIALKFNKSQTTIRYFLLKYKIVKNNSNLSKVDIEGNKVCPCCKTLKSYNQYYFQSGKYPRQGSWCKECMNKQVTLRQRKYKQQALDYKGSKCQICGYNTYQGALEFHHIDPNQKDFEMSKFSRNSLTNEAKIELDKCVLLCANCHREVHAGLIVLPIS